MQVEESVQFTILAIQHINVSIKLHKELVN